MINGDKPLYAREMGNSDAKVGSNSHKAGLIGATIGYVRSGGVGESRGGLAQILQEKGGGPAGSDKILSTVDNKSSLRIFCQPISSRLTQEFQLGLQESLYLIQDSVHAFKNLLELFPSGFQINDSLIVFDFTRNVKVWANSNFALIEAESSPLVQDFQHYIISRTLDLWEPHIIGGQFSQRFKYLRNKYLKAPFRYLQFGSFVNYVGRERQRAVSSRKGNSFVQS